MVKRSSTKNPRRAGETDVTISPRDVPTPVRAQDLGSGPRWTRALAITVDGQSGSGKSTLARLLAETLGFQYLDTGGMYRALAWLALERGISLDDAARLRGLAIADPVSTGFGNAHHNDGEPSEGWRVRIAGFDVTEEIRGADIGEAASLVARHPAVRDVLVARQRQISLTRDTVLDGRDCGTVIRPDADCKFFVTADLDERARRRGGQLAALGSKRPRQRSVAQDLKTRDERDAPNSAAATDALTVDTTASDVDTTLEQMVECWLRRKHELLDDEIIGGQTARAWIENDFGESFKRSVGRTRWLWKRGFRLETHGVSRVPKRNCMFVANHSSMWDPAFVIIPLNRPVRYMAKVEAARIPVYGRLGDSIGMFPVRRGAGDRVSLHIAESVLRRGDSLGIFPEGTRIYEGRLARAKHGAARMALITGVPIVPVAIYGNRWRESLGKVSVAFGAPIATAGKRATPSNIAAVTDELWSEVEELWAALRAGRRA